MSDYRDHIASVPTPSQADLEAAVLDAGDGLVYFVQADEHGPIKIGYTTRHRLRSRIGVLQTGSAFPLRLRRTFPGTRDLERKLHRYFADLRMRGEWFWPDPELVAVAHGNAVELT